MAVQQRGLNQDQEQTTSALIRDTRTMGQHFSEFLKNSTNVAILILILGALGFIVPAISDILFIIGAVLFFIS
ncbi:MAG: hypothetical protein KKE11_02985, partial [Gammaproteobacteria bacterium]|nr:hypothetical protein [Gammaproteobacteria bacterium]